MEEPDGKNVKVQRWSQQPYCATLCTVGSLTVWLLDRPGFLSSDLFCLQMWQWLLVVGFFWYILSFQFLCLCTSCVGEHGRCLLPHAQPAAGHT